MITLNGILVPVDFSKESILATKFAVSLAQEYKTKLYLLHVMEMIPTWAQLEISNYEEFQERTMKQAKEDLFRVIPSKVRETIEVDEILETGYPSQVILDKAQELGVDVIVIATHGRTGLAHMLLGSVAEKVIRHAPCPVFVVRNPKDKYVYGWEE
jgi:nucleotide-binding universal stress UspA family protein